MIPSLSQEELTQYASDAQTIQQPQGTDYSQGVKAGRTIPAKWWNWLFSASTKRITQSRTDANNILTELKNVVTDAGLTPTASDNTQLTQAVEAKAEVQIDSYILDKKEYMKTWERLESASLKSYIDHIGNKALISQVGTQGGVYSFAIRGRGGSSNLYYEFLSRNGLDWERHHTPFIGEETRQREAIYFTKGEYTFAIVGAYPHFYIYRTSDLKNWQLLTEIGVGEYILGGYVVVFELNNFIYAFFNRSSGSSDAVREIVKFDSSGTATQVSLDIVPNGIYTMFSKQTTGDAWFPGMWTPVKFNETQYLVGPGLFNGTNWDFNTLPNISPSGSIPADMRLFEFSDGKRIIYSDKASTSWMTFAAGSNTPVVQTDTDSLEFIPIKGDKSKIICHSGNNYKFTSDGINFTSMSYHSEAGEIFYRGGNYYWGEKFSADLLTWYDVENLHQTLEDITGRSFSQVVLAASTFTDAVYCYGIVSGNAQVNMFVSLDNMQSWSNTNILENASSSWSPQSDLLTPNELELQNGVLTRGRLSEALTGRVSALQQTFNYVNRVIGHTLYLR